VSKALSIALGVLVVTLCVPTAQAERPPAAAKSNTVVQAPPSPIAAQERGRRNDPRLFNVGATTPVQIVGAPDSFDYADASIGGALALSFAALAGAVVVVRKGRRRRSFGVAA
jgi:hypothetical protein